MSARLNDWQRPVRIKDLAGVPIDEQKKAANIVLSYLDRFDTTFLDRTRFQDHAGAEGPRAR